MSAANPKISIVAPMFNEEANLSSTLSQVTAELKRNDYNDYEIIFVNDGSTDNTWVEADKLADAHAQLKVVGYGENQGRGKALRTGIDAAQGDIIVTIDFDLTYDVSHITRMIQTLNENETVDVVLASCYMPGGKTIGVPKFRLFVSKGANLLYRFAYTPQIYTSTCVVRAYRKDAVKYLGLLSDGKEIHLEILSKTLSNGFKVKEIPGTLTRRDDEEAVKGAPRKTFKFRSQTIAHLIYFIQEKPFYVFGFLGFLLSGLGMLSSLILIYTRFADNPEFNETIISKLASPNFVIIMFIAGLQMMGIGFLGIQNNYMKKEVYRLHNLINKR